MAGWPLLLVLSIMLRLNNLRLENGSDNGQVRLLCDMARGGDVTTFRFRSARNCAISSPLTAMTPFSPWCFLTPWSWARISLSKAPYPNACIMAV